MNHPTQARLKELLTYNPETGECSPCGYLDTSNGYYRLVVDGRRQYLHRLIWCLMTGEWPSPRKMDHKDLDRTNNRWANLRKATVSQQQANRGMQINCTSGIKGVSFCKATGRWRADIRVEGRSINLGRAETKEAAAALYAAGAELHHGEFARVA